MQTLINTASWKPVPVGLAGDAEFRVTRARLAKRLYVFGEIGLNSQGREEHKIAKQIGCQIPTNFDNQIILFTSFFT